LEALLGKISHLKDLVLTDLKTYNSNISDMLPTISAGDYMLVYNMLSFTIAAMLAAFVFFILGQQRVAPKYRISLIVSALVVGIAAYHYFRITHSWESAYTLTGATYSASGTPFNDAYRYVDWLLTVPLLLVELILVLSMARDKSGPLLTKLAVAAVLMIALGYPGEIMAFEDKTLMGAYGLWGTLSSIPFAYILYVLWTELGSSMGNQPERVGVLFRNMRLLLLLTWGFYPIVYCLPFFGMDPAQAVVGIQVGYAIADVAAKAGYGVMIYAIAREKSLAEGYEPS
jgi:bacteriorhodopsin